MLTAISNVRTRRSHRRRNEALDVVQRFIDCTRYYNSYDASIQLEMDRSQTILDASRVELSVRAQAIA